MVYVIEIGLIIILAALWFTQIALPIMRNEPWFPMFWSKEDQLKRKANKLKQQLDETKCEEMVEELEEQLKEKREEGDKSG